MIEKNRALVTVDPARNLVRFSFAGDIGAKEIKLYEKSIEEALATVPRGFFLLADLTDLNSMDLLCVPYISRTMDRFRRHGVARIVRIIPDHRKDIGFSILSLFHYPRGLLIVTCDTRAEAEQALK